MTTGQVFRVLRAARGFSQGELASRSGIQRAYISLIETRRPAPGHRAKRRLCAALDFPEWAVSALTIAQDTQHTPEVRVELGLLLLGLFEGRQP